MEYFEQLDTYLKTYWAFAIISGLIFIIQTVLTFSGTDASDGTEADFDGDLHDAEAPFQLFSLRNMVNFFLGMGWSGLALHPYIENKIVLTLVTVAIGVGFVMLFFVIIKQIKKLAEDNSFRIEQVVGKTADVYLTIPENKTGKGKIQISVNGSIHELPAMTEGEKISTGATVKVSRIESETIVIVEQL